MWADINLMTEQMLKRRKDQKRKVEGFRLIDRKEENVEKLRKALETTKAGDHWENVSK